MWAWGVDTADEFFVNLIRVFSNFRHAELCRPIAWSLHNVLAFFSGVEFCIAGNLDMALSKALILIALATDSRVSELLALRRELEFLAFGNHILTLVSRVSFLAKNEDPMHRYFPIVIPRLWDGTGALSLSARGMQSRGESHFFFFYWTFVSLFLYS